MSSGWDVRTNIKAKIGSQGTLFQGGTEQMRPERYPRGYTPERLHEVAGAMFHQGTKSTYLRSRDDTDIGGIKRDAKPMRNMVDTVARSTVPVEHLQGRVRPARGAYEKDTKFQLGFWSHEGTPETLNRDNSQPGTVAGHYTRNAGAQADQIHVDPEYTGSPTVIHEIGHHLSALQHNPHSAEGGYRTEAQRGREEAFADDYAMEHYRNRNRKPETQKMYGGGPFMLKRSDEFWDQYRGGRQTPMYEPSPAKDPWYPPEHVEGQRTFYHKNLAYEGSSDVGSVLKALPQSMREELGQDKYTYEEPYHPDDEETGPHPWAKRHLEHPGLEQIRRRRG